MLERPHVQAEPDHGQHRDGYEHPHSAPDLPQEDHCEEDDDGVRLPHLVHVVLDGARQRPVSAHHEGVEQVGDQEFERRDVELGISNGIFVEVKSGVTETDKIKVWNQLQGPPKYAGRN